MEIVEGHVADSVHILDENAGTMTAMPGADRSMYRRLTVDPR